MESILAQSEAMAEAGAEFLPGSKEARWKMCLREWKWNLMIGGAVVLLLIIIIAAASGGDDASSSANSSGGAPMATITALSDSTSAIKDTIGGTVNLTSGAGGAMSE